MSLQLGKLAGGAGEEDLGKTVDTARREVEAWAHDALQAQADFDFAERRLERADRERSKGGERLSAEALKAASLIYLMALLTALYPVSTVVLARVVLRERFHLLQRVGMAVAIPATVLMVA